MSLVYFGRDIDHGHILIDRVNVTILKIRATKKKQAM